VRYLRVSTEDLTAKTKETEALVESLFPSLSKLPVASLSLFHRYYGKHLSLSISDIYFLHLVSNFFSSESGDGVELSVFQHKVTELYHEEKISENHLKLISYFIVEFPVDIYSIEPGLCYSSETLVSLPASMTKATKAILFPSFLKDLCFNVCPASVISLDAKKTFLLHLSEVDLSSSSQSRKGKKAKIIKISDEASTDGYPKSPASSIDRPSPHLNLNKLINSVLLPYLNIVQRLEAVCNAKSVRKSTKQWTSSDFTSFLRHFIQHCIESSSACVLYFLSHFSAVFFGMCSLPIVPSASFMNSSSTETTLNGSLEEVINLFRSCNSFFSPPSSESFPLEEQLLLSVFTAVENEFFSSLLSLGASFQSPHLCEEAIEKIFQNFSKLKMLFYYIFKLFRKTNERNHNQEELFLLWNDLVSRLTHDTAFFLAQKPITMESLSENREIQSSSSFSTWFHSLKKLNDSEAWTSILLNTESNDDSEIVIFSPVLVPLVFLQFLFQEVCQDMEILQSEKFVHVLKMVKSQINSLQSLYYFCFLFYTQMDFFAGFMLTLQMSPMSSTIESISSSAISNLFVIVFADDPSRTCTVSGVGLLEKILSGYVHFLEKRQPLNNLEDGASFTKSSKFIELLLFGLRFYLIIPYCVSDSSQLLAPGDLRSYLSLALSCSSTDDLHYVFPPSLFQSVKCFLHLTVLSHHWSLLIDLLVIDFPFIQLAFAASITASDGNDVDWLSILESEIEKEIEKENLLKRVDGSLLLDLVKFPFFVCCSLI
jgi:hypothetical protein